MWMKSINHQLLLASSCIKIIDCCLKPVGDQTMQYYYYIILKDILVLYKETKQRAQKKGCGGKAIYGKETFICFKLYQL